MPLNVAAVPTPSTVDITVARRLPATTVRLDEFLPAGVTAYKTDTMLLNWGKYMVPLTGSTIKLRTQPLGTGAPFSHSVDDAPSTPGDVRFTRRMRPPPDSATSSAPAPPPLASKYRPLGALNWICVPTPSAETQPVPDMVRVMGGVAVRFTARREHGAEKQETYSVLEDASMATPRVFEKAAFVPTPSVFAVRLPDDGSDVTFIVARSIRRSVVGRLAGGAVE